MFLLWLLFGRDSKPTVTVEVRPPDELDPLEMEYILSEQITDKGIFSMILYWAAKGLIDLCETEHLHIARCLGEISDSAPLHAQKLFGLLFDKQEHVIFENMPIEVEKGSDDIQDMLKDEIGEVTTLWVKCGIFD